MSRRNHNPRTWPPSQQSHRGKRGRNGTHREDKLQRADDQIAPSAMSTSIDRLQRWALLTADLPQQGHMRAKARQNDREIVERIQQRYQSPTNSQHLHHAPPHGSETEQHVSAQHPFQSQVHDKGLKRDYPSDPFNSPQLQLIGVNAGEFVESTKRRRMYSPSPEASVHHSGLSLKCLTDHLGSVDGVEENVYYQSSEWSFPNSDCGEVLSCHQDTFIDPGISA